MPRPATAAKPRTSQTKAQRNATAVTRATLGQNPRSIWQPQEQKRLTGLQLLQRYGRWVFRCIELNSLTAAAVRPRLYAVGGKDVVEKCARFKPKSLDTRTKAFFKGKMALQPGSRARKMLAGNIDDMTELTDHPALMILDDVNPWDEGFSFRQMWYADLDLFGRFFTQLVVDQSNVPVELWRMLPFLSDVLPDPVNFVKGFKYGRGPDPHIFTPDEVFWVKTMDIANPWGGMGWVEPWVQSIDAEFTMSAYNEWLFNRGGSPDYLLMSKGNMTPEQKKAWRAEYRRMFGNMGRREEGVAIMTGEATLEKLSQTPREMQYADSSEAKRDEICAAAGVPKSMITTDDVNRSNAAESNPQHTRNVWAKVQRVEDAINQRLLPRWSDRLVLIHENPLKEDQTIRIQQDESDLRSGYSINEIRIRKGDEPLDDPKADAPMLANDVVPLSMAGQPQGMPTLPSASGAAMPPDGSEASPDAATLAAAAGVEGTMPPSGNVQTTEASVLNGAQIASATGIIVAVVAGELPRDSGIGQLIVLFNLSKDQAELMMGSAGTKTPTTPNPNPKEEEQQQREADMAQAQLDAAAQKPSTAAPSSGKMLGDGAVSRKTGGPDDAGGRTDDPTAGRDAGGDGPDDDGPAPGSDDSADAGLGGPADCGCRVGGACAGTLVAGAVKTWADALGRFKSFANISTKASPGSPGDEIVPRFQQNMEAILRASIIAALNELGNAQDAIEAVKGALAALKDPRWEEALYAAAKPFVASAIAIGGQAGMSHPLLVERFGYDPFNVANPEVQKFVDNYTARLASDVAEFTHVKASELLGDGLAQGESITQLADRIRPWAEADPLTPSIGGAKYRSEMIARTESARAYVKGEQLAWKQTGVVSGKQWLLAPDACPICEEAAAQFANKTIPLDANFYDKGDTIDTGDGEMKLDYEDIDGPPLHPSCRCDLIPVLEGE